LLAPGEEKKLILATATGLEPAPFSEHNLDPVFQWARGVRSGQYVLDLVLGGHLLPVGIDNDGEIIFRTVEGTPSATAAEEYQRALQEIELPKRAGSPDGTEQDAATDAGVLLSDAEEARLRLALTATTTWEGLAALGPADLLDFARDCRRGTRLLHGVLDGVLLPQPARCAGEVTFRRVDELPVEDQKAYGKHFRGIEQEDQ
jgi:hypothetical protein